MLKNSLPYILVLAIVFIVYQMLNPNKVVEMQTEYVKGDTITKVKYDSLYFTKTVESKISDTVFIDHIPDVGKMVYIPKTDFEIKTDTSGVKGKVSFDKDRFSFSDIKFWFPVTMIERIDTLKIASLVEKPLLSNEWFYTTIISLALLIAMILK